MLTFWGCWWDSSQIMQAEPIAQPRSHLNVCSQSPPLTCQALETPRPRRMRANISKARGSPSSLPPPHPFDNCPWAEALKRRLCL